MQVVVMEGLADCEFPQAKVIMHRLSTSRLCGPCFTRLKVGHRRILGNVRYVLAGERRAIRVEAVQSRTDKKRQ
jgi:hypothetical protein